MADDFCKFFNETVKKHTLQVTDGKRHRDKPNRMSDAEVMTILIAFHMGGHRCLKHFYLGYVCKHWGHLFPKTVSYNRFVELEREVALPLLVFVKQVLLGKCTGVNFVDSTPMRVCRNQRIHGHKVFRGIAMRGKCSMGWFFGFKMHLIINEKGEVLSFMITPADVDDREPLKVKDFVKKIYGKLVGMVDTTGRPIFQPDAQAGAKGQLVGFPIKQEDGIADNKILIGYPKTVVGNIIQDIMVETDRDIKKHVITYAGYARAEFKLVAEKAFALLTVTPS